ncbi:MAG: Spo0B domain-containing protein [Acetatifactor sp.]|nr:Spo0B domain-containing protein [Acetatifactor sp.]
MREMDFSLYFCLAMVVILMLCLLWMFLLYVKLRRRYDSLVESCGQMQKLNSELRSQRHDYLNHMQVVYGMAELEEYEELRGYLEPIYRDMMKVGKAIRTSVPAVNALLMAKMGEAEAGQIDFYVEVKSDLKDLKIEPWELCKVLSNLIDNAITALSEKETDRKMVLDISEDREHYLFSVSDNGAPVPKDIRTAIFRQCFSTRREAGHGMGLYIVSNVLRANGGSIRLESDEKETVFTVKLKTSGESVSCAAPERE